MRFRGEEGLEGRKVLVVDDHDQTRQLLHALLGSVGCEVRLASGGQEALARLADFLPDLVLLDVRMDDMDGLEVLRRGRADGRVTNYVMMSGEATVPLAVEAIHLGAVDFLLKPFDLTTLLKVVGRVLARAHRAGDKDPRIEWRDSYAPEMRGHHESLLEIFLVLERVADTDCTVLITGESGTGKELVARAVHAASIRRASELVPVNCGAIPETLIESELFGHTKGAFSGATQRREGRFAAADKGTLFLDEIGEMSLAVQVKLLRVLQEGEYVPVGETRPRKVDVRIIAATHQDLEKMVAAGTFREDLLYRLNMIPIHLPPLRARGADVIDLAEHFLRRHNRRREQRIAGFTDEAIDLLSKYAWPGNVRELENVIQRAGLLHVGGGPLRADELPAKLQSATPRRPETLDTDASVELPPSPAAVSASTPPPESGVTVVTGARPSTPGAERGGDDSPRAPARSSLEVELPVDGIHLRDAVERFESSLIAQALARTGGNKQRAAELLRINRTTLVEKLRKRDRRRRAGPHQPD